MRKKIKSTSKNGTVQKSQVVFSLLFETGGWKKVHKFMSPPTLEIIILINLTVVLCSFDGSINSFHLH